MQLLLVSNNISIKTIINEWNKRFINKEDFQQRQDTFSLEIARQFDLLYKRTEKYYIFYDKMVEIDNYLRVMEA